MRKMIGLAMILILAGITYSPLDSWAKTGICDICDGGSPSEKKVGNCDEGWCAKFDDGSYRCVPDNVNYGDGYECVTGGGGDGGGGGCFISTPGRYRGQTYTLDN